MATTFQNFQSEMDQIRTKENAKQRKQVVPSVDKPVVKGKTKDPVPEAVVNAVSVAPDSGGDMVETEEDIMVRHKPVYIIASTLTLVKTALLSRTPAGHDRARDSIASLITRNHGEYVLRIGSHPPQSQLFNDLEEINDDADGWSGIERSIEDLDFLKEEITQTVEEVGGKVWFILSIWWISLNAFQYRPVSCLNLRKEHILGYASYFVFLLRMFH